MWVACLHVSSSEKGAVQIKVHSVPLKVQTSAAKRSQAQRRADTHRHPHSTDPEGTLSQKSITGFWHMPEKHNRILLCPEAERERHKNRMRVRVKHRYEKIESKSFTHTLLVFSSLMVLWTNLIVRVQTAARGAVCVFCRSRSEIQEKVLRVILQKTQSRRRDRECYKAIPPRSSCRQDQLAEMELT